MNQCCHIILNILFLIMMLEYVANKDIFEKLHRYVEDNKFIAPSLDNEQHLMTQYTVQQ